jgi:hypothetical protein
MEAMANSLTSLAVMSLKRLDPVICLERAHYSTQAGLTDAATFRCAGKFNSCES